MDKLQKQSLELVRRYDTEIMNLYEYLTDQKKKGLFNFRSINNIKNDAFKKFLQKLVNRLIDLKGYCEKYKIDVFYENYYFDGLLLLFNDIIEKNKELKIDIDILYDLKRYISINYFKFLNKLYEYYIEKFKDFIRKKEYPYNINKKIDIIKLKSLFESFIKSLSNKSEPSNIVFIDNLHLPGKTPPDSTYFIKKYHEYKKFIEKIKILIKQAKSPNIANNNTLNKLNKENEESIDQLKENIELLDKKLKEQIKSNVNNQNRKNQYFKRISIEAERERKNNPPSKPVINWTSMYFKGNQYNPREELPTDPEEIKKAQQRFERKQEKERLQRNAQHCSNIYQQYSNEEYRRCSNAAHKLKNMNRENSPQIVISSQTLNRIGRMS
jgi:hypothetical protein